MARAGIIAASWVIEVRASTRTAPELVFEVARRAVLASGIPRPAIDLTVSASSDVLDGRSFGFAYALEALGAHPPTLESHLEMDGAWAAYYAWLKILAGEASSALVVAWGKSSEAPLSLVTSSQLDPFTLAPLGLDHIASAALQADAWMQRTKATMSDLDAVVRRARENALVSATVPPLAPLAEPDDPVATPLFRRHCPRSADGACAVVMAAEHAIPKGKRVAWIRGADHRSETGALGCRDLSELPFARRAAARAREIAGWTCDVDIAELAAPFAHQEPMLREALDLGAATIVSPSGGALVADPIMATGLVRLSECAGRVDAKAPRGLAHAAAGHALQQNMVWLLEAGA
jgi:acetyl-CoA acetyltransferase